MNIREAVAKLMELGEKHGYETDLVIPGIGKHESGQYCETIQKLQKIDRLAFAKMTCNSSYGRHVGPSVICLGGFGGLDDRRHKSPDEIICRGPVNLMTFSPNA